MPCEPHGRWGPSAPQAAGVPKRRKTLALARQKHPSEISFSNPETELGFDRALNQSLNLLLDWSLNQTELGLIGL